MLKVWMELCQMNDLHFFLTVMFDISNSNW